MKPAYLFFFTTLLVVFPARQLLAKAQKDRLDEQSQLLIYTVYSNELSETLIKEFRQRTAIHVQLEYGSADELIRRLYLEADKPKADILWGLTTDTLEKHTVLLSPYKTAASAYIPAFMRDTKDSWTAFLYYPTEPMLEVNHQDFIIEAVALILDAPHQDAARQFIDFLLNKDVQTIVSAVWQRCPARQDVKQPDIISPTCTPEAKP